MKLTPDPTPYGQGLYALIHRKTQSIYIGSSTNLRGRMAEWRSNLKTKRRPLPPAFPSDNPEEWEFRVVQRTEGMTYQQTRDAETALIAKAKGNGATLLNRVAPATMTRHIVDGIEGSVTFHASRLGVNPTNVIERMKAGKTIEQALRPPPHDPRTHAIAMMPVQLLDAAGQPMTYAEAATAQGRSVNSVKDWVARKRKIDPNLKHLQI